MATNSNTNSDNMNCIINTEYSFRIIIPVINGLLGILIYIYNDDLLDPNGLKKMHVIIGSVNVVAMFLALINDSLKTRFDSLKKYKDDLERFNANNNLIMRSVSPLNNKIYIPDEPLLLNNILPFKTKLS